MSATKATEILLKLLVYPNSFYKMLKDLFNYF